MSQGKTVMDQNDKNNFLVLGLLVKNTSILI